MERRPSNRLYLQIKRKPLFQAEVEAEMTFSTDEEILLEFEAHGFVWTSELAYQIQGVVENPTVVFGGLNRENHEHCLCYVGYPGSCYSQSASLWGTGQLALAYARPLEGEIFFFDWDLRPGTGRSGLPANYEQDFGESILWF